MSTSRGWDIVFDVQVDALPAALSTLERTAAAVLEQCAVERATVTVTIVGDAAMRAYNERFLDTSSATDVISFDLSDEFEASRVFDLIINAEMAERESCRRGHTAEAELALYLVHGLLHNLGFDDGTVEDASRMHQTEDALLKTLGFDSVYYEQSSDHDKDIMNKERK